MSARRLAAISLLFFGALSLGFPVVFLVVHGLSPEGWLELEDTPREWFAMPGQNLLLAISGVVVRVVVTYAKMASGSYYAFADGGKIEFFAIATATIFIWCAIVGSANLEPLRHRTRRFGDARFATKRALAKMQTGVELGLDPTTRRPVRVAIEGNLLTIAPPRRGKTTGLVLPNLAFCDPNAWNGPAIVVDPKGDAYKASRRRRIAMGRRVRCLDPLGIVGGEDRWNPLIRHSSNDITYLQAMAVALLPRSDNSSSDAGAFFRDRAAVIIVAAILASAENGRNDAVSAAELVRDADRLLVVLEGRDQAVFDDARSILKGDQRTRDNIMTTANQALSWLLDIRMQNVVRGHTFSMNDLCDGDTDLFVVLPADDRKLIIAPYIRWLIADIFAAVRQKPVNERIILFQDEAYVGACDAIVSGAGELPGYGLSLWTIWQSEAQLEAAYGPHGAATLMDTAEVLQIFNVPRANAEECQRWSDALGTYTGVDVTEAFDPKTGKLTKSFSAGSVPLVHPADISEQTKHHSFVFLNIPSYTTDPLKLAKTRADLDRRFRGLLDVVRPVGPLNPRTGR